MNADRLLTHYEKIAVAPDAIARLRRFILDLAVRGKLVPQDAKDEPASELLKRIAMEKSRLVKAGEISKSHPLEAIRDAKALCALPSTWAWVRVDDIFDYDAGTKRDPKELDQSRWLLELEDIEKDTSRIVERLRVSDRDSQSTKSEFEPGDILYGKLRPYLNKVVVADERGYSTTEIVAIRPFLRLCPEFCALAFRRPDFVAYVERLGRGTKMPRLRTPDAIVAPFPLPPLAEQHRIVAKVDELMGLCDRLAVARAGREAARDRLSAASLARLSAPDPKTFPADARFALDALRALTTRPDQIKALRQTILSLAVRGKLVPQDAEEKAPRLPPLRQFAAASGIDDEVFEQTRGSISLPSGWQIAPLAQLSENIVDCPHTTPKWTESGEICIRTNQLRPRALDLSEPRYVSSEAYIERIERLEPKADDILYSREGGILGIACRVPPGIRLCLGQRLMLIRAGTATRADFLEIVLNSPFITDIAKARTTGGAAPRVNMSTVRAYPIPIPPLTEQNRIVAKVDELMALCNGLEASLTATAITRRRLLDALLAEALASSDATTEAALTESVAGTAVSKTAVEMERSALILTLAYERHRLAKRDRTFGHVKAQKILHFVEAEADFDLGRAPVRDAAGPNDFRHMLAVEKWALQHRRFAFEKNGSGYTFRSLSDFQKSLASVTSLDAGTRARLKRVIDLFIPMDMEAAEIFATVYAAWNNLLIEGKSPEDGDIIRAARDEWHPQKLKIPRERFVAALRLLRKSDFVPSGRGKFVPSSHQQDLFLKR